MTEETERKIISQMGIVDVMALYRSGYVFLDIDDRLRSLNDIIATLDEKDKCDEQRDGE